MAIFDDLLSAVSDYPNATALEYKGQKISFRQLYEESAQVAAGFHEMGFKSQTAVGIMLPNVPQFLAITYGSFFCGHIVTPISVLSTPREIAHVVHDSAIEVLFVFASFLPAVQEAISSFECPPEIVVIGETPGNYICYRDFIDTNNNVMLSQISTNQHLLTLYTSGTTGASKGVMISDQNMQTQIEMIGRVFKPAKGTRILCVLPLFHAYALNAIIMMSIRYRATVVLHDRFVAEACAASLAGDNIQWFAGVPTMYSMLLEYGKANPELIFPELEVCLTGGAAMNPEVLEEFEAHFETAIYEGYGLTETTVSVASNSYPESNRKIGSVGRIYPGMKCRVLDESGEHVSPGQVGELVFRGGNVMLGYLNRPDETTMVIKDEWLHSGDLGYIDEDGFCFIVGRKKDLIVKSGYNIVPLEIEEALRHVKAIQDACVVGVPDPVRGEQILAAIIIDDTTSRATARIQIQATVSALLAKYKHPNHIWFVEHFPLGPTGKILKKTIRENWLAQEKILKVEENAYIPA